MTLTSPTAATTELSAKLDELSAQVAFLAEEARINRQRRERWDELQHDVMPVAADALAVVGRELEDLDVDIAELTGLLKRLVRVAPLLDTALSQVEMYADFAHELVPIGGEAMEAATSKLATLEERGYFDFAKGAVRVADRVVTGFTEEDVEALGDNVVLILETIKDLTQPEVMAALHRMISAIREQQRHIAEEPAEPPSLFSIMRQLRDPEIRRGMARGLNTLRAVSEAEINGKQVKETSNTSGGN